MDIQNLVDVIIGHIKKVKHQFINIDDVSELLRTRLGDNYSSEIGIEVKSALKLHESIDFFRQGDYITDEKFHFCTGNWLATKGLYGNPIEAKTKLGWYSWQDTEEINWED